MSRSAGAPSGRSDPGRPDTGPLNQGPLNQERPDQGQPDPARSAAQSAWFEALGGDQHFSGSSSAEDADPADASLAALERWQSALRAAAVLALDPHRLGGAVLCHRDLDLAAVWSDIFSACVPRQMPSRAVPAGVTHDMLAGGIDLAATLAMGARTAAAGLLADVSGGVLTAHTAHLLDAPATAAIARALDAHKVALIAAVEAAPGDPPMEAVPAPLAERASLVIDLTDITATALPGLATALAQPGAADAGQLAFFSPQEFAELRAAVTEARPRAAAITIDDAAISAICDVAHAFGVPGLRTAVACVHTARLSAALGGRAAVAQADVAFAIRHVLAPRATRIPVGPADGEAEETNAAQEPDETPAPGNSAEQPAEPPQRHAPEPLDFPPPNNPDSERQDDEAPVDLDNGQVREMLVASALASLPAGLLAQLAADGRRASGPQSGRGQARSASRGRRKPRRGRPTGHEPGTLGGTQPLHVLATLTTAAPWQGVRRRALSPARQQTAPCIMLRPEDVRVRTFKSPARTCVIFVV
ncbi:MAG: hypothetical protein AAFO79_05815, partial [Pseudomonadota bacterium]